LKRVTIIFSVITVFFSLSCNSVAASEGFPGSRREPAGQAAARLVRTPADTVGYPTTPAEVEEILRISSAMESERFALNEKDHPVISRKNMLAAICPHDDYLYAGSAYAHAARYLRAPVVIMFGVSHAARRKGIEGKLIFESFDAWKGPYGELPVSRLREQLIEALPQDYVMVSNDIHAAEHSLEALLPLVQYRFRKGVEANKASRSGGAGNDLNCRPEIVPVLVTRFQGGSQAVAADTLAGALARLLLKKGWRLGEDVQILISADCVHYGDQKWGSRNYAPYGTGEEGYRTAVEREMEIIDSSLVGKVSPERIGNFRRMVEKDDLEWPYKITWCGVYSIPFGLSALRRLTQLTEGRSPRGVLLRYGTTLDPGRIEMESGDMGVTNIATYRHWVGHAAVGYW